MVETEKHHTLKVITWIIAYLVWIPILLIPIAGIIYTVAILLKNSSQINTLKAPVKNGASNWQSIR